MKNDLRCYVCGKPIPDQCDTGGQETLFYLVSMSENVDRVFIVDTECLPQVKDDAKIAVMVERVH